MTHDLVKSDYGWHCQLCEWDWKSKPPRVCPAIPRFDWWSETRYEMTGVKPHRNPPENYKTEKQLRKDGLKPNGQPVGCIRLKSSGWLYLYDAGDTSPTFVSSAQKQALAKGRAVMAESRRLCEQHQGLLEPYKDWLIELRPTDMQWHIGVHSPSGGGFKYSGLFPSHVRALAFGKKLIDWIRANPDQIEYWGCYTGDKADGGLGITIYRRPQVPWTTQETDQG